MLPIRCLKFDPDWNFFFYTDRYLKRGRFPMHILSPARYRYSHKVPFLPAPIFYIKLSLEYKCTHRFLLTLPKYLNPKRFIPSHNNIMTIFNNELSQSKVRLQSIKIIHHCHSVLWVEMHTPNSLQPELMITSQPRQSAAVVSVLIVS